MGRPKGSRNKPPAKAAKASVKEISEEVETALADSVFEDTTEDPDPPEDEEQEAEPQTAIERAVTKLAGTVDRFVTGQAESNPVRKIPWAKFKTRSKFNPTGSKKRALNRRCYQNGARLFVPNLHDEEIALLNQLEPGKYIDGMVTVHEVINGSNTDLHIVYNNSKDQQMANLEQWNSLTMLLKRCVTEGPMDAAALRKVQRSA